MGFNFDRKPKITTGKCTEVIQENPAYIHLSMNKVMWNSVSATVKTFVNCDLSEHL